MAYLQFFDSSIINSNSKTLEAFTALQAENLPHLSIPQNIQQLEDLQNIADRFSKSFEKIVVYGTGGSSLGGQTLAALNPASADKLIFMDNIDPTTLDHLLQSIDLKNTGFIIISKSGNTSETMCQAHMTIEEWQQQFADSSLAQNFLAITESKDSALTQLASEHNIPTLEHPSNIGGRFAALTLVGLLPAMIAGCDARQILAGAQWTLDNPQAACEGASIALAMEQKSMFVMMPYIDRMHRFAYWYRQLWAESIGKDGYGPTPVAALGTVDQHSQLQLFLDGPDDKFYTLLTTDHEEKGHKLKAGYHVGDLMAAMQFATEKTLQNNGRTVRRLHLPEVNEFSMGALMMHFILETLLVAKIKKIDAFNQPAVEESKQLAREFLAKKTNGQAA